MTDPDYLWSAEWKKVSVDRIIDTIEGPDRDNMMSLAPVSWPSPRQYGDERSIANDPGVTNRTSS